MTVQPAPFAKMPTGVFPVMAKLLRFIINYNKFYMELLTKGCQETNIIDKEHHRETTAGSVNSYFEISNLLILVRFAVAFFMLEILNDADHCNDNTDYSDSNSNNLQRDQVRLLHTCISRMYHLPKYRKFQRIHHWFGANRYPFDNALCKFIYSINYSNIQSISTHFPKKRK